jgi:hypothetical protein
MACGRKGAPGLSLREKDVRLIAARGVEDLLRAGRQ